MTFPLLRRVMAFVLSIFTLILYPFFGDFTGDFVPKDAYGVKLNFATISDVHMSESPVRSFMLGLALKDMAKAEYPLDALVIAGDITDDGEQPQWEVLKTVFEQNNAVKNVVLATGNHDTWTGETSPRTSSELFKDYSRQIAGRELDNVYYSTKINGYTFVVLGSEGTDVSAYFSDAQLQWLSETMSVAAHDGLPIFVVCHQPINGSHGLPETWGEDEPKPDDGGMGEQSQAVEAILKSYRNVFLISGHIHSGIGDKVTEKLNGYKSIESDGSFHSVNLPSYMFSGAHGQLANGNGFQFEVYADKVVIRARSYSSGVWYTCYDYEIPLV